MNYVQSLCEESELGIPVVFSMDSVIGASWINDTTILPDAITLGATGDAELVQELADIQRQEMKALGVRMSLSPNADLATDPRWGAQSGNLRRGRGYRQGDGRLRRLRACRTARMALALIPSCPA